MNSLQTSLSIKSKRYFLDQFLACKTPLTKKLVLGLLEMVTELSFWCVCIPPFDRKSQDPVFSTQQYDER